MTQYYFYLAILAFQKKCLTFKQRPTDYLRFNDSAIPLTQLDKIADRFLKPRYQEIQKRPDSPLF